MSSKTIEQVYALITDRRRGGVGGKYGVVSTPEGLYNAVQQLLLERQARVFPQDDWRGMAFKLEDDRTMIVGVNLKDGMIRIRSGWSLPFEAHLEPVTGTVPIFPLHQDPI